MHDGRPPNGSRYLSIMSDKATSEARRANLSTQRGFPRRMRADHACEKDTRRPPSRGAVPVTHPSGTVKLTSQHRLFDTMRNLVFIVDALFTAVSAIKNGADWNGMANGLLPFKSTQFGVTVSLPVGALMPAIVNNKPVRTIWVAFFLTKDIGPPLRKTAHTATLPPRILENMITPLYVDFFERYLPWIKANCGGDAYAWSPLLNFGRAVRNWISHHQGCVHFDNCQAGPVNWHHLSYSPADKGRQVVGRDLQFGDMIILLFELADELDRLGCPL